jgi:Fe2+ or Zn2+ uptake regulation protein
MPVYRALQLFKECGLAYERNFGDGKAKYEPVRFEGEHHDHPYAQLRQDNRVF